jgi:hypothetical protein
MYDEELQELVLRYEIMDLQGLVRKYQVMDVRELTYDARFRVFCGYVGERWTVWTSGGVTLGSGACETRLRTH